MGSGLTDFHVSSTPSLTNLGYQKGKNIIMIATDPSVQWTIIVIPSMLYHIRFNK